VARPRLSKLGLRFVALGYLAVILVGPLLAVVVVIALGKTFGSF